MNKKKTFILYNLFDVIIFQTYLFYLYFVISKKQKLNNNLKYDFVLKHDDCTMSPSDVHFLYFYKIYYYFF